MRNYFRNYTMIHTFVIVITISYEHILGKFDF